MAKDMTDMERVTTAMREIEIILAEYIEPGPRTQKDAEKTIDRIFDAMDRDGVQASVARLRGERNRLKLVE